MSSNQTPDLLVLAATLLALLFSPPLAAVLAPYVVIIIGALAGAGWALKRREPTTRGGTLAFVALLLGTALILTMPAAVWLQRYTGTGTTQWLIAPLALAIAAVGDDWPKLGAWGFSAAKDWWTRRGAPPAPPAA